MTESDTLIVGQGIAGTALAWELHWRGVPFAIVDANEPNTSSKVAAGLITPITGKRFALSWRIRELLPIAIAYYARISAQLGCEPFFVRTPIVRLFQSAEEREQYRQKSHTFGDLARIPIALNPAWFRSEYDGFEMPLAGYLRAAEYLHRSRLAFGERFRIASITSTDLTIQPNAIHIPKLNLSVRGAIFCEGVGAMNNLYFPSLKFTPAKGEILTLSIPELQESRIVNRGVWLMPESGNLYRTGSTYNRDRCDSMPTEEGRAEILSRLREFLRLPFEVVDHVAAVRPIADDRLPLLGFHPEVPHLGYFNGLGSKGALLAPHFAAELANRMASNR